MARRKSKAKAATYYLFNVTYEDGTVTSNRRVAGKRLDQSYGDDLLDLARIVIEEQDDEIAQLSNQPRAKIKLIARA